MGNTFSNIVDSIGRWLKTPFNAGGSALNWVLFVGLLVVAAYFWQITLLHIEGEL